MKVTTPKQAAIMREVSERGAKNFRVIGGRYINKRVAIMMLRSGLPRHVDFQGHDFRCANKLLDTSS